VSTIDQPPATAKYRWGVLGAGRISQQFVSELATSRTGVLAGVASTDLVRATALAAGFRDVSAYGEYAALLADRDIDAVYIATLHPQHRDLIVAAAEAGKHILCEKPLTVTGQDAETAAGSARACGVVLVEAMMYRFQPQTHLLGSVLRGGTIGTPVHVDVSCAFATQFDPLDRLFDSAAGGGAILDVGCYAMSFARMVAGWTVDDDAVQALTLDAAGHRAATGVDDWAVASMTFPGGFTANVRTGTRVADSSEARIYGSAGHIHVPNPWTPGKDGREPHLLVRGIGDREARLLACDPAPLFGAEIDAVWEARENGESAAISIRDSLATMHSLDRWRAGIPT
jgi:predicted dehydrogenase